MTREEAIESLKRDIHNAKISGHQTNHYEMAINALEQQPSDGEITITMKKGTLKYSGHGYVAYNKDWFRKHFATEVAIITGYDGYIEQQPSEDCVSRAELKKWLDVNFSFGGALRKIEMFDRIDKELPPVTPTKCIANIQFSKEDLKKICEERIEIAMEHGTCKDCKYNVKDKRTTTMCDIGHRFYMREPSTFYCADFEKRGE